MQTLPNHNLLFYGKNLAELINKYETEIRSEVDQWERNTVLAANEPDLISYLVEKYKLDPPRLLRDKIHIESEGEINSYSPSFFVTVAVPFKGYSDLFNYKASTFTLNPPRGRILESKVLISFQCIQLDDLQIRKNIDSTVDKIEENLNFVKHECNEWNARVQPLAEQYVHTRKRRLLEQANMVSALGLPMKKYPDTMMTSVSVPVIRKKRPIVLPPTPKEAFQPEPELPGTEYDFILNIIDKLSQSIERSPSTFSQMNEEQIRDLILVSLNGHYEGNATGETFNADGKTDILIRSENREAELVPLFWTGV